MKEDTKHEKALNDFKIIADSCKKTGYYASLDDHTVIVAGNKYFCAVIIEDSECMVYEKMPQLKCTEIGRFKL